MQTVTPKDTADAFSWRRKTSDVSSDSVYPDEDSTASRRRFKTPAASAKRSGEFTLRQEAEIIIGSRVTI